MRTFHGQRYEIPACFRCFLRNIYLLQVRARHLSHHALLTIAQCQYHLRLYREARDPVLGEP
jgi:hypothetical protein